MYLVSIIKIHDSAKKGDISDFAMQNKYVLSYCPKSHHLNNSVLSNSGNSVLKLY